MNGPPEIERQRADYRKLQYLCRIRGTIRRRAVVSAGPKRSVTKLWLQYAARRGSFESVCHRPSTFLEFTRAYQRARSRGGELQSSPPRPATGAAANLLSSLPREVAGKLLSAERARTLAAGAILFERGDPGDGCYWLQKGVLKVSVASASGEQRILAILGPGAIVGELAMLDGLPRSATVEAVRDCELTFVSRAAFADILNSHPELYRDIAATLVARLRQSDEDMGAASFLTVRARVARALLQFARHLGEDRGEGQILIRHKVTQYDLAAMAGVARESVSRTLVDWKRRHVLERSSPGGYVVHKARLEEEAAAAE